MKKVKRVPRIKEIRKLLDAHPKWTPLEVAHAAECHPTIVYREIKRRRAQEYPLFNTKNQEIPAAKVLQAEPPKAEKVHNLLELSIRLPINGNAVIQVRNGSTTLLGTLILESDGIRYKRPNQKIAADRKLSWNTLEKLMQLGIM